MTFGSLFSGIGGLDLGLERAGMVCKFQVEIDPYCRAVLEKHWPDVPRWDDAKTFPPDATGNGRNKRWSERELGVDLICGGFPCQPVSVAGKRGGTADSRWLWPEFARILGVLRPRYALVENVPGLLAANGGGAMSAVLGDLASLGYDAEWTSIPAAAVGAPHLRYRVFLVAYTSSPGTIRYGENQTLCGNGGEILPSRIQTAEGPIPGRNSSSEDVADAQIFGRQVRSATGERQGRPAGGGDDVSDPPGTRFFTRRPEADQTSWDETRGPESERYNWWATEPDVGRVAHGIPNRVDRLRALGNAVVPQVAEWVGKQILKAEDVTGASIHAVAAGKKMPC